MSGLYLFGAQSTNANHWLLMLSSIEDASSSRVSTLARCWLCLPSGSRVRCPLFETGCTLTVSGLFAARFSLSSHLGVILCAPDTSHLKIGWLVQLRKLLRVHMGTTSWPLRVFGWVVRHPWSGPMISNTLHLVGAYSIGGGAGWGGG